MCGRFVAAADPDGLLKFFVIDDRKADDVPPSWNVAPTMPVLAVAEHGDRRLLVSFRWGLVPFWADDPKIGSRLINARAETVADKPAFRESFERRRCLVPADGFYEWHKRPDGSKAPYFVHHADGVPLAFAGLWSSWRDREDPDAPPLRTCTIVTTQAAPSISAIHHRMPVLLGPDDWATWLSPDAPRAAVEPLLRPSEEPLALRRVSTAVNDVRNDHPGLVEPVEDEAPPSEPTPPNPA